MAGTGETSIRSYRFYVRDTSGPALTTDFKDAKFVFVDKGDGKTIFTSTGIIIDDSNADEIAVLVRRSDCRRRTETPRSDELLPEAFQGHSLSARKRRRRALPGYGLVAGGFR